MVCHTCVLGSEFAESVQAILVNPVPAGPLRPSSPVRDDLGRNRLLRLLLERLVSFLLVLPSGNMDQACKPGSKMEVVFARSGAAQEAALGQQSREVVQNERGNRLPVYLRLLVEVIRGCLAIVDGKDASVACYLVLVELLEWRGFLRLGVLLKRVLAWNIEFRTGVCLGGGGSLLTVLYEGLGEATCSRLQFILVALMA